MYILRSMVCVTCSLFAKLLVYLNVKRTVTASKRRMGQRRTLATIKDRSQPQKCQLKLFKKRYTNYLKEQYVKFHILYCNLTANIFFIFSFGQLGQELLLLSL